MKALLDSSTLIAAMLPDHAHHGPAHAWLAQAKLGDFDFYVSAHSLAEVYSVLTRLPRTPPITPPEAWRMLRENVCSCAKIVSLSGDDYVGLMIDLSQRGVRGGQVFDAIIARAAELAQIDQLVTLNDTHFRAVWPSGATCVVTPLSTAPPPKS